MTTAAIQTMPVVLPRRQARSQQRRLTTAPAAPVSERNPSRIEDAVSLTLMSGIAVAGIGAMAWASYYVFSEVTRLGFQSVLHSMIGVAY